MARWALRQKHYLKVEGTRWRYEETDRETGERNEQEFPVPRLLDPDSPRDCRTAGQCVVAYKGSEVRGDWVFTGPPTPDMEPLDDEAKALSAGWEPKWANPISDLPSQGGFSDALLAGLEKQLTAAFANAGAMVQPTSLKGVSQEDFTKLQEQVAALMAENAEMKAAKPAGRR